MAILEVEFDGPVERVIESIETRPLRGGLVLHDRTQTAVHLAQTLAHAQKMGDIFWGITREEDGNPIAQTKEKKIAILHGTVALIPDIEDYAPRAYDWLIDPDPSTVEKLMHRKIGVELSPRMKKLFPRSPQTAIEVYRTPSTFELAHEALTQIGDPVTAIIDTYENHILDREVEVDKRIIDMGKSALEHFAFGASGHSFVELLGNANKTFHESEIQRRKLVI